MSSNEIWVFKDDCYDVGCGGSSISVYRTLEDAMEDNFNLSFCWAGRDCPGKWVEVEPGQWEVEYEIPEKGWMRESDLTYSSVKSIGVCKFGDRV